MRERFEIRSHKSLWGFIQITSISFPRGPTERNSIREEMSGQQYAEGFQLFHRKLKGKEERKTKKKLRDIKQGRWYNANKLNGHSKESHMIRANTQPSHSLPRPTAHLDATEH